MTVIWTDTDLCLRFVRLDDVRFSHCSFVVVVVSVAVVSVAVVVVAVVVVDDDDDDDDDDDEERDEVLHLTCVALLTAAQQ